MIDYGALDAIAVKQMKGRKAHLMRERGFIYNHCRRVSKAVITLRTRVTDDDSHDDALRIAAMFHDIGKGMEPHNHTGAALVRLLLADALPAGLLEEVAGLIEAHTERQSTDLWENLLQDADTIDHFGTVDVGMAFQYGAYSEKGMDEALGWYTDPQGFAQTTAECRRTLHFEAARAVFEDRVAFAEAFFVRLGREMAGEYV